MDRFKALVAPEIRDYVSFTVVTISGAYAVIKASGTVISWISNKRLQRRWRDTPKDVVVLHRIQPAITCPNASPFVLKLETYLRMTKIPYEIDLADGMGPKGKTPWITLNGEHISDSQLCIEFLQRKFAKKLGEKYTEQQRSLSSMARLMMDEHFYWGLLMWRYVHSIPKGYGPETIFAMPKLLLKFFMALYGTRAIKTGAYFQGIGRHTESEIVAIISQDLKHLSKILGNKKFILGEEPCEDDCAIFGELAQALWCMPGSPYEKLINDELHNLKQYCLRMKDVYWPDWDDCLANSSIKKIN